MTKASMVKGHITYKIYIEVEVEVQKISASTLTLKETNREKNRSDYQTVQTG